MLCSYFQKGERKCTRLVLHFLKNVDNAKIYRSFVDLDNKTSGIFKKITKFIEDKREKTRAINKIAFIFMELKDCISCWIVTTNKSLCIRLKYCTDF